MAGDENSTDIMAGLNEVVTAINDLVVTSSCIPQVNVTCDGTGGGTQGPSEGGTEDGPPPTGWTDPPDLFGTPEYDTRKCKIANAIHASLVEWLTLWETYDVDGLASAFLTIALISLLGAMVGEISTPVPLLDGVIGFVIGFLSGIAIAIITGGFNLTSILSLMSTYEQDLVCALYDATSTQDGIDDYIQVLDDNGASAGDILLLETVVVIDLLNNLFFKRGEAVDDALASYTSPLSCSSCGVCEWFILFGTGTILTDGTEFTLSSEFDGAAYRIQFLKSNFCCPNTGVVEVISWTGTPNNGWGVWIWDGACPGTLRTEAIPTVTTGSRSAMRVSQVELSFSFDITFKITTF